MADFGFFFNSVNGDRVCNADSFKTWIRSFFTNGVTIGSFESAKSGDTKITVSPGFVNINGTVQHFKESQEFEIQRGSGYRYDTIVIEYNSDDDVRDVIMKIVKGGAEPVAPIQYSSLYQLVVATIYVPESGDITIQDNREDDTKCGYIKITASEKSAEDIAAEFVTYMALYMNEKQTDFNAWFNAIKQETSDKMAGNVDVVMGNIQSAQQMINDLDAFIDSTSEDMSESLDAAKSSALKGYGRYICNIVDKSGYNAYTSTHPDYDIVETDRKLTEDKLKKLVMIEASSKLNKPITALYEYSQYDNIPSGFAFGIGCFDLIGSSEIYMCSRENGMLRKNTENTSAGTSKGYEFSHDYMKIQLVNGQITSTYDDMFFDLDPLDFSNYDEGRIAYGRYSTSAGLYTTE